MTDPPGRSGYRLPAEFEPHEATWMAWPHDERTWIAGLEQAEEAFAIMVEALSHGERVALIVRAEDRSRARDVLSTRSLGKVELYEKDHADAWLRDTGPTVLVGEEDRIAVDWRFDAWGGKYEDLERDDDVAAFVAEQEGLDRWRVQEVCEGGAIETDGRGALLTTTDCLIEARGHASKADVEALFDRVLGAEEVLWVSGRLAGDDTDGHVDTMIRFLGPGTLALATSSNPKHPDHATLTRLRDRIETELDSRARDTTFVELPQPEPVRVAGEIRPATYANFYIGNDVVLLPTFQRPTDDVAHERLQAALPDRRVVPVPARGLVAGYGACHCVTQQIPNPPKT